MTVDPRTWNHRTVREVEHASIRRFVQAAADDGFLSGRVLDWGCGQQPYRAIVEGAGGDYLGYDRVSFPSNVSGEDHGAEFEVFSGGFDTVLCNQVIQYMPRPWVWLGTLQSVFLKPGGHLVMTYPTNWDEVEPADLHRFTRAGMERMLRTYQILRHERRAEVELGGFRFPLGYGVIARA